MERLTYVTENGEVLFHPADLPDDEGMTITQLAENGRYKDLEEIAERLANREQAEEQGFLLRLPCKVGDTVYCIFSRYTKCTHNSEEFDEYSCQGCEYECDSKREKYIQDMRAYSLDWIVTNLQNFGKTVFLTIEEAEAKLKEMEE